MAIGGWTKAPGGASGRRNDREDQIMGDSHKACLRAPRVGDTCLAFAPLPGFQTCLLDTVLAHRVHP